MRPLQVPTGYTYQFSTGHVHMSWPNGVGVSRGWHGHIPWITILNCCYPQDMYMMSTSYTHGIQHYLTPTGYLHVLHTMYTQDFNPRDIANCPRDTPTGYNKSNASTGYHMFSTGYIHGICNPRDILKCPRDASTGYNCNNVVHGIVVVHGIWYPVDDNLTCYPRDSLHWIKRSPHHIPTGYTPLYPVGIWCGHIPWTTYPVGSASSTDETLNDLNDNTTSRFES